MDDFGIYAILGVSSPPRRLPSAEGGRRVSVAVPRDARQVVLFTAGPWGERICVNAELNDADRMPITVGKLTRYNKCLSWEKWEEETWTKSATLDVSLEDGTLDNVPPLAARDLNSKRKRERTPGEDGDEDAVTTGREDENARPNGGVPKARCQTKGRQKRVDGGGGGGAAAKTKTKTKRVNETGQTQRTAGRTPARSAAAQAPAPVGPSGRWGQTLCPVGAQTAILIGGQGARTQFCRDPMWKLCTEDLSWVAAETLAEGPTPEARIGHSAVYDSDSRRIFLFGGSKNRKWFNDVHILDTRSWKWTTVEAQGKVPPLSYHSCSMFRGELFVLGGVFPRPNPEPDGCSDSLHIFDPQLSIWYQPVVTGAVPSPRSGHSACLMQERKICVFGGWDTPVCYNDVHVLDLGLMEFSELKTSGTAPSPRSWHGSAALSGTKFLIHGGYDGNRALGDAFVFDMESNSWTEVMLPQLVLPRAGHSIITMETGARWADDEDADGDGDAVVKTLLVFGGGDNEGHFYSDLRSVAVEELLAAI
ncbi:kelch repeat-containing protein [Brachionichthys hirsutus]|uniref:kelch repeat-containing protein n=1 Tax=Brachionichthys hirsutus TaxID=412623 RepID=UPI003604AC90